MQQVTCPPLDSDLTSKEEEGVAEGTREGPAVVRFHPEILTTEGPEELQDELETDKILEREIIQYLQRFKQHDNWDRTVRPSNSGRVKKWNLVRQRFHENREVFVSRLPRVTSVTNHSYLEKKRNDKLLNHFIFRSKEWNRFILLVLDPAFGRS